MNENQRNDFGTKLKSLKDAYNSLSKNSDDIENLIRIIHNPGWTTPAEFLFAMGITESLISQIHVSQSLNKALIRACYQVNSGESEIDEETADFFAKVYKKEKKINIASLLEDPSSFAEKSGVEISENVVKRIENLKKKGKHKKYPVDDPVNIEIVEFYNKAVINGKYIEEWATNPEQVAEKLHYKVSRQAIERIKEMDISRFIGHHGGEVGIIWIVVGIVVGVIVLVDLTALNKDRVIIDKSGILKL